MSLVLELKRKLENSNEILQKRLKLAENAISCPLFNLSNSSNVIIEWLCDYLEKNNDPDISKHLFISFKFMVKIFNFKIVSTEIISRLLNILSEFLKKFVLFDTKFDGNDTSAFYLECCINLMENSTINYIINNCIDEYFILVKILFECLIKKKIFFNNMKINEMDGSNYNCYENMLFGALSILSINFKKINKKSLLADKFINSKLFWTFHTLFDNEKFANKTLNFCQNIIIPNVSLPLLRTCLYAFVEEENITTLMKEKGENLRPIMSFVKIIVETPTDFMLNDTHLCSFLKFFMHSCRSDDSIIFLFNLILYKALGINQNYINISKCIPIQKLDKKIIKKVHLQNLIYISKYNINININLTLNQNNSKSIEKQNFNFINFMQQLTSIILSDEIIDPLLLCIIKQTYLIDSVILEPTLLEILPNIIIKREKNLEENFNLYDDILINMLETKFKSGHSSEFIISLIKGLYLKINSLKTNKNDIDIHNLFSNVFLNRFGKCSSDLTFIQQIRLFDNLISLLNQYYLDIQKDENCRKSLIIIGLLNIFLTYFFTYSKIADPTIPEMTFNKYIDLFNGNCYDTLKSMISLLLNYPDVQFKKTVLELALSYGHVKLLLLRYQPHYVYNELQLNEEFNIKSSQLSNISLLHSYGSNHQWKKIFKMIKSDNPSLHNIMIHLILQNLLLMKHKGKFPQIENFVLITKNINSFIIDNFEHNIRLFLENKYVNIIFETFDINDMKMISNKIIEITLNCDLNTELAIDFIKKNEFEYQNLFLNTITIETLRHIWVDFDRKNIIKNFPSLYNYSDSHEFNIISFIEEIDNFEKYINKLFDSNIFKNNNSVLKFNKYLFLINELPIQYLDENIQNCTIFTVIILQSVLIKDYIQENKEMKIMNKYLKLIISRIFELSPKLPNIFNMFPVSIFMKMIKTKLWLLTNDWNSASHSLEMLKNIFMGVINKENARHLLSLTETFIKGIDDAEKNCIEILESECFQSLCLFLTVLNNIKKSSLSSEIKNIVDNYQIKTIEKIYQILISLKNSNMLIDSINNINKQYPKNNFKLIVANILGSFSIVLNQYIINVKTFMDLCEIIQLLLKEALSILIKKDINLIHAQNSCNFINVILNKTKLMNKILSNLDQYIYFPLIWSSSKVYLSSNKKNQTEWLDVTNMVCENIILTYELCDVKLFNRYIVKEFIDVKSFVIDENTINTSSEKSYVIRKLWCCFLNSNFKELGKNELRTSLIKQIVRKIYYCINNMPNNNVLNYEDVNIYNSERARENVDDNLNTTVISFEIIFEIINMKKMNLSNSVIDDIIQLPLMIDFVINNKILAKENSSDIFFILHEKCTNLLNCLLVNRSELLQDRWQLYFLSYRKLIDVLCIKSNTDNMYNNNIENFIKLSHNIEKITKMMTKKVKNDISRLISYVIVDIILSLQKVTVHSLVKFHIHNCIYYMIELLDNHGKGFLMRNMNDSSRIMFQELCEIYNKYHKYVGIS